MEFEQKERPIRVVKGLTMATLEKTPKEIMIMTYKKLVSIPLSALHDFCSEENDIDNLCNIDYETMSVDVEMEFNYQAPLIRRIYRLVDFNETGSFKRGHIYMGLKSGVRYIAAGSNYLGILSGDIRPSNESFYIDTDFAEIGSSFSNN